MFLYRILLLLLLSLSSHLIIIGEKYALGRTPEGAQYLLLLACLLCRSSGGVSSGPYWGGVTNLGLSNDLLNVPLFFSSES